MSPDELVDVVEVTRFCHGAVVVAVRQLFPHYDLGLAQPEQLLHVTRSMLPLVDVQVRRSKQRIILTARSHPAVR